MNLLQALSYFVREAAASLLRSWRGSSVAILTCALSLYVGSFFFLISGNLVRQTESWQGSLKISAYLAEGAAPDALERIMATMTEPPWIEDATLVSQEEAQRRFDSAFPQIAEALGDGTAMELPASIEATILAGFVERQAWTDWVGELRTLDGVASVDDDRDWITEVQRFSLWIRSAGVAISLALLIAAAFTIAAVVRLTAYQYLDEISVLRMVGATEFYVRGPFILEGFLQGLLGGLLAIGGLWATFLVAAAQIGDSLWLAFIFDRFLSGQSQLLLVLVGGGAGLIGSFLSIRREALEETG